LVEYTAFISKERFSELSVPDCELLLNLCKIHSRFRVWKHVITSQNETKREMIDLLRNYELIGICASIFYEAEITLLRADKLGAKVRHRLTDQAKVLYEESKARFSTRETDEYYKISDLVRNRLSFHFDAELYKGSFSEGEASQELILGEIKHIEKDGTILQDVLFRSPYDYDIQHIFHFLPKEVEQKNFLVWMIAKTSAKLETTMVLVNHMIFSLFGSKVDLRERGH